MNANIFSHITFYSWIGYYDAYTEGNWKWIGYNKTIFTNWNVNKPNNNGDQDCAQLHFLRPPYWNDNQCSDLCHFICADFNDYPTTLAPAPPTTTTPTKVLKLSTEQTINYMKEVSYNAVCSNLVDNYDLKYETTLHECIAICQNMGDLCRMINFYHYFKSVDDSRCYIFERICNIVAVDNNETDQSSILYYKVNDDDLCINYPTDWIDDIADNCDAYLMYDWCNNGTIQRNENDFYELMHHGLDAIHTCCECGGGANIVDHIAVSIDRDWIDHNTDILCSVTLQNKRDWDNLYLYHFCDSVQQTNCAYLLNKNFKPTNYSYSIYLCKNSQTEHHDIEFIFDQQINDDHLSHDTYVNLQWFNIDATLYSTNISIIYLNYSKCIHSLLYIDSNHTYNQGIHPCYSLDRDSAANNTTNEPTKATIVSEFISHSTISEFMTSHSLTINSASDIFEVPPSENMSESESYRIVSVILICVLSLSVDCVYNDCIFTEKIECYRNQR
eukprot:426579_1